MNKDRPAGDGCHPDFLLRRYHGLEFHGEALESTAGYLGTTIEYTPRKTPWHKGAVERWFRTLQEDATDGVPGRTFSSILEKGEYDPKGSAVVMMETLREIVIRWIVDVYHQREHSAIGTTPAQAWRNLESGIERGLPVHAQDLDPRLGKTMTRRLDHRGVTNTYVWYNSDSLAAMRMRHGDVLSVDVTYDPEDLGSVCVFDPETGHPVEVPALCPEYATGLALNQHKMLRKRAKQAGRDSTDIRELEEVKSELRDLVRQDTKKVKHKGKRGSQPKADGQAASMDSGKTEAPASDRKASTPKDASADRPDAKQKRQKAAGKQSRASASAASTGRAAKRERGRNVYDSSPMPTATGANASTNGKNRRKA